MSSADEALIFDLYRGTSHDGPGLRSTVFFKGCPLRCTWCHNPEGLSSLQEVWWTERSCIGCALCQAACPSGCRSMEPDGIHIDRNRCTVCGACVRACPAEAMTFVARKISLSELIKEVLKDKGYYDQTGGGVTASGGEAMLQSGFIAAFFTELHEYGVNTALDTCGLCDYSRYELVLPCTDYVLYDLKLMDEDAHIRYTGKSNGLILENIKQIASDIRTGRFCSKLWIRTPLIPNATDSNENISQIGAFIAGYLGDAVERWELCAFNNSCITKYQRLGISWKFAHTPILNDAEVQRIRIAAEKSGFDKNKILISGVIAGT